MIETENRLMLEMEWVRGGSLKQLIETRRKLNKEFSDEEASSLIKGIAQATEYIHSKNIIHRDIKPGLLAK